MDQELTSLLNQESRESDTNDMPAGESHVRFIDNRTGEIELVGADERQPPRRHMLKPLNDLYGQGTGRETLDPRDGLFLPLMMSIEEPILEEFEKNPRLTDAKVAIALDRLCNSPENDPGPDELARRIQNRLRFCLSVNDYSRQDVRHALRKIAKSVARHTREAGPFGYLRFIQEHLPH